MATKQSNEAKVLAMKGALVGFTVLGTIMGWAQFSAESMANAPGATAALGQPVTTAQAAATATPAQSAAAIRTVVSTNAGTLRQVSAAPAPATRTRSSR